MKRIFDWMRVVVDALDAVNDLNIQNGDKCAKGARTAYRNVQGVINEAEQKWEEDCCEWKLLHDGCFIQNPHTTRMFSNEESMQNVYCNTCGKKIRKIKEVE